MLFPPDHSDVLRRIPLSARSVLDVGCGTAMFAATYRAMNPRVRLLGLAIDPAAAALAAPHMDQVAPAGLDAGTLPMDLDCIVYNEILEHLADPWTVVRRHAAALGPDGMMLICARNAEYWRIADAVLRGTWDSDARLLPGLTRSAVQDAMADAGMMVCDVTPRSPDTQDAARFAASLAPGLEALDVDPDEYARRAAPSHLIWRVRRQPCQRMILSGNMLNPVGGVSHVRVVYPVQAMATDPTVIANVTDRVEISPPADVTSRIFVLHRPALLGEQGHATLRGLIEAGFLVVTEFDDLPDHFDMMRMGGDLGFRGVHAVQTSTNAMAEAIRQYNSEIAVFPNAIGRLPEIRNFADPNVTTVFFGALNREPDWRPLMPAMNAAAAMAGDRLRFQVVHDQAFFDALDTPHKHFTPTCDHETYMDILGGSEICLMPLGDTKFNRAKSDLKFIEAGSCRVAALASSVVYANSIEDGRTGLLFRDPVEFHARLLHLLAMPELARDLADAARKYVAGERMLAYQVAPRLAWYRSLWARREALGDARRQRMMRYRAAA